MEKSDIHPIKEQLIKQTEKESFLGHKGAVFWLYGLSGSGKSTLAIEMERRLHKQGYLSVVLDGDNLRSSLNKDLGFSDEDRKESVRRVSEVAKLLCENGLIVFVSLITPLKEFRDNARSIIGSENFKEIYIKASFETCLKRDVKGLYAKANQGLINSFIGKDRILRNLKTLTSQSKAKTIC